MVHKTVFTIELLLLKYKFYEPDIHLKIMKVSKNGSALKVSKFYAFMSKFL